jgi:hypothetical protein
MSIVSSRRTPAARPTCRAPHGSRVTICGPVTPAGRRCPPVLLTSLVNERTAGPGVARNEIAPPGMGAQAGRLISHPVRETCPHFTRPRPSRPALLAAPPRVSAGADVHSLPVTIPRGERGLANARRASRCRKADEVIKRVFMRTWPSPAGSVSWCRKHESRHRCGAERRGLEPGRRPPCAGGPDLATSGRDSQGRTGYGVRPELSRGGWALCAVR